MSFVSRILSLSSLKDYIYETYIEAIRVKNDDDSDTILVEVKNVELDLTHLFVKKKIPLSLISEDVSSRLNIEVHYTFTPGQRATRDTPAVDNDIDFKDAYIFIGSRKIEFNELFDLKITSRNKLKHYWIEDIEGA